ncbi:hypothetical protein G6M26_25705 [Agrobacterium tumefaciens]|nr:hypothetical protein [Agrobacterium tumefaciens]NTE21945.1 hypothetical protein [Agrobacterium tumefaciens]
MKKVSLLLCSSLLCNACATMQKSDATLKEARVQNLQMKTMQISKLEWNKQTSDSDMTNLEIEMWPKGMVKYSPGSGFEGEMTRLVLRKKEHHHLTTVEQVKGSSVIRTDLKQRETSQVKVKSHQKYKITPLVWLSLLLLPAGYLVYKFWWRNVERV